MTGRDARESVLRAVAAELHVGPLARRRILTELGDHIDDAVDDLCRAGASRDEAINEAVMRIGDAETIARSFGGMRSRLRVRRSLAWTMVAAMSLVTALAAELPQASGAKPPAKVPAPAARRLAAGTAAAAGPARGGLAHRRSR